MHWQKETLGCTADMAHACSLWPGSSNAALYLPSPLLHVSFISEQICGLSTAVEEHHTWKTRLVNLHMGTKDWLQLSKKGFALGGILHVLVPTCIAYVDCPHTHTKRKGLACTHTNMHFSFFIHVKIYNMHASKVRCSDHTHLYWNCLISLSEQGIKMWPTWMLKVIASENAHLCLWFVIA